MKEMRKKEKLNNLSKLQEFNFEKQNALLKNTSNTRDQLIEKQIKA